MTKKFTRKSWHAIMVGEELKNWFATEATTNNLTYDEFLLTLKNLYDTRTRDTTGVDQ